MKNWIQEIVPQAKAKNRPLHERIEACIPTLKDAANCLPPPGGYYKDFLSAVIESVAEYKYAKPFMTELVLALPQHFSRERLERAAQHSPFITQVLASKRQSLAVAGAQAAALAEDDIERSIEEASHVRTGRPRP